MRPAYAIHNSDTGPAILVFTSHESRDAYCFRSIFEGCHTRRITCREARKIYGRCPSHDTCRDTLTDNPLYNFHVLPIPAALAGGAA